MTITLRDLEEQKAISDKHENDPTISREARQYWTRIGNKVRALIQALKDNEEILTCNYCAGMSEWDKAQCKHYRV